MAAAPAGVAAAPHGQLQQIVQIVRQQPGSCLLGGLARGGACAVPAQATACGSSANRQAEAAR
eukprot:7510435-Alexandrium_andersonii.AAC.1